MRLTLFLFLSRADIQSLFVLFGGLSYVLKLAPFIIGKRLLSLFFVWDGVQYCRISLKGVVVHATMWRGYSDDWYPRETVVPYFEHESIACNDVAESKQTLAHRDGMASMDEFFRAEQPEMASDLLDKAECSFSEASNAKSPHWQSLLASALLDLHRNRVEDAHGKLDVSSSRIHNLRDALSNDDDHCFSSVQKSSFQMHTKCTSILVWCAK